MKAVLPAICITGSGQTIKPRIQRVQALADILCSGYAVIATKPRLQIRPIVHN